jgi:hypothetical protein
MPILQPTAALRNRCRRIVAPKNVGIDDDKIFMRAYLRFRPGPCAIGVDGGHSYNFVPS